MHEDYLRLTANLRMDTHWEDKGVILPIREVELLLPQSLYNMGIDEALRSCTPRDRL